MKVNEWISKNSLILAAAGIDTARLDCLVLMEDAVGKDRSWLLAHPEFELTNSQLKKLNLQVRKRLNHYPLAYIRGKTEFYGREFIVNQDVLEPRPESETMIEIMKTLPFTSSILDVGTGSGALAVTAKLELPEVEVTATDVDAKCLKVAKKNAIKHKAKINFLKGDLLDPVNGKNDVVLANLPYVPDDYTLNDAAKLEPKLAIFGGKDGLDIYRKLFAQIANLSHFPKYILTESLPFQHRELVNIAASAGYTLSEEKDFIQLFSIKLK